MEHELRTFLGEQLAIRCQRNPRYSLRAFARDLQLAPSTLSEVINGKTRLTRKSMGGICTKLGCSPEEKEHLYDLASLADSNPITRKNALTRIRARLGDSFFLNIGVQDEEKRKVTLSHFLVIEIVRVLKDRASNENIAKRLQLSKVQSSKIIADLVSWEILAKTPSGFEVLKQGITFETGNASETLRSMYRELMKKALIAIEGQDLETREFGFQVFPMDQSDLPKLKKRVRDFYLQIAKEFSATENKNVVYGYFGQLFRMDIQPESES